MSMTKEEYLAKNQIRNKLASQGYPTYSHLLSYFDVNLTSDPNVIAYANMEKSVIVLNRNLDINQVSVVVRHEILHRYLDHWTRLESHVGKEKWDARTSLEQQLANIAADYEISNRGYTEEDKRTIRNLLLNGKIVSGLVTEDDHPNWVNLPLEDMYDNLLQDKQATEQELQNQLQHLQDLMGDYKSKITDLEDIEREAHKIQVDAEGNVYDEDGDFLGKVIEAEDEDSANGKTSKEAQKVADQAEKVADQAGELKDTITAAISPQPSESDKVFKNNRNRDLEEIDRDIQIKAERIKKAFEDVQLKDQILKETETAVLKDQQLQADKKARRQFQQNTTARFLDSLDRVIKKQVARRKESSWKRRSRITTWGSTAILKGRALEDQRSIPKVAVYYDRSGSWDASKTAIGDKAISMLKQNYERKGLIAIDLFYFADDVSGNPDSVGVGTTAGQKILDHIKQIKADNVIIMTDGDMNRLKFEPMTVDGGVWYLFVGGVCNSIAKALKGKAGTFVYKLEKGN